MIACCGMAARATKSEVVVRVRADGGTMSESNLIANVSMGGVFVGMREPLAFGAEVQLEFILPVEPRTLRCPGFVVWSTKTSPDKARGQVGVAVRLTTLK